MIRLPMSSAAAALLRAIVSRANVDRNRILLSEATTTDWQSLTFCGERHSLTLRMAGADAHLIGERICDGLGEAEFDLPGAIVADIAAPAGLVRSADGAIELTIEALTVADD